MSAYTGIPPVFKQYSQSNSMFRCLRPRCLRLRSLWSLLFGCITVLSACLASTAAATPAEAGSAAAQRQQPDWQKLAQNLGSGEFWLHSEAGRLQASALSQTTDIRLNIQGMTAHVEMTQTFRNTSDQWLAGRYLFPLPDEAAVHAYELRTGNRRIKGIIKEKQAARQSYEQAKAAGKKASLLSQQRPNLFTSRIANIAPGEEIQVVLQYIQPVRFAEGRFSLRLPTTLTPRYQAASTRAAENAGHTEGANARDSLQISANGWSSNAEENAEEGARQQAQRPHRNEKVIAETVQSRFQTSEGRAPGNRFRFTASLDSGLPLKTINSLYHELNIQRQQQRYNLELQTDTAPMDRDLVLHWQPQASAMPQAALFRESLDDADYGLLMLMPPLVHSRADTRAHTPESKETLHESPKIISRTMTYVIDISGSMSGISIPQAKQALLKSLQRLRPEDHFNIIAYNSNTHRLFATDQPATAKQKLRAQHFVRSLQASGGTEMMPALLQALNTNDPERLQQIIFITDGTVNNEAELIAKVSERLGDKRLFTIGIGSAPNAYFMRKMAEIGRGSFTFIGHVDEVNKRMDALLRLLEQPQLQNIQIHWPQGMDIEQYPEKTPDLYAGEPLLLRIKASAIAGTINISGELAESRWQQSLKLNNKKAQGGDGQHPGIAKSWARAKIAALMDKAHEGWQPEDIKNAVLPLALQHQLVSPYTSFVAIEEQISRPAEKSLHNQKLANRLPHGQSKTLAFPATATSAAQKLIQGFGLLLAAGLLMLLHSRTRQARAKAR